VTQPNRPPGVPDPGTRPPKVPTNLPGIGGAVVGGVGVVADAQTAAGQQLDDLLGIGSSVAAARAWISDRHNLVRVAWFGGGVICFAIGAAMLARPAASAAATVIPAGKVARALK
jgi:hypothetical protein